MSGSGAWVVIDLVLVLQGRCIGGEDLFAHKKEFGSIEPYIGMPVSFLVEATEKGDAAKK